MTRKCGVCARSARATSRVYVYDGPGGVRRVLACSRCAARAVPLVMHAPEGRCNAKRDGRACGEIATLCASCSNAREPRQRAEIVKGAVRKIRAIARAYAINAAACATRDARVDGLAQAADLLEGGDW